MATAKPRWEDVAKTAQDHRDASICRVDPSVSNVPSELPKDVTGIPKRLLSINEVVITQTSPEDLVTSLASGKLNSTQVANAFLRRAGVAQKLVIIPNDPEKPELCSLLSLRRTVSPSYYPKKPCKEPNTLTTFIRNTNAQWALSMASQSASKNTSA